MTTQVKFTVAMNSEEKKAGNIKEVILNVNFEGVDEALIHKYALANMVVQYQSQIRTHWTEFVEKGIPETIDFGTPLYAKSTAQRTVTTEDAANYVNNLSPVKRLELIISTMQAAGMDTELYEEELAALTAANEEEE